MTQDRTPNDGSSLVDYSRFRFNQQKSTDLKWLIVDDILVSDPLKDMARPSMASAPNGDLYVAAKDLGSSWIHIYRSTDGGVSWSPPHMIASGTDSRHPSITYAERSNGAKLIYVAFEKVLADESREIIVYRDCLTGPCGSSEFVTVAGPMTMGTSSEHIQPRITTDYLEYPDNHWVYITYTVLDGSDYPIYFSRSSDLGATWTTPVDVSGGSVATTWLPRPDIAFGEAGLFIAFVKPGWTGSTIANQVWVTKSTNWGDDWSSPVQLTSSEANQYHPAVAAAHDTNSVLVVYTRDYPSDSDLNCAYSTDGGDTWSMDRGVATLIGEDERYADVEASHHVDDPGWFHVVYDWRGGVEEVRYGRMPTSDPSWPGFGGFRINKSTAVSPIYSRPAIAVDPTKSGEAEACIAWTVPRGATNDVYFAREWEIFSDGFEEGNTSTWSTTVGGP
jgi:hypothetical protein